MKEYFVSEPQTERMLIITFHDLFRLIITMIMATATSIGGYKKRSLDRSGAIAGAFVGLSIGIGGLRCLSALFFFFVSSSLVTRLNPERKKKIEDGFKQGGQRNWHQVFANGLGAAVCCWLLVLFWNSLPSSPSSHLSLLPPEDPIDFHSPQNLSEEERRWHWWSSWLLLAVVAHFGCCNGDTWASEVGIAFGPSKPLLLFGFSNITKNKDKKRQLRLLQRVPAGTNGGISLVGTLASLVGGLLVGFSFIFPSLVISYLCPPNLTSLLFHPVASDSESSLTFLSIVMMGGMAGFFGSLVSASFSCLSLSFPSYPTLSLKSPSERPLILSRASTQPPKRSIL